MVDLTDDVAKAYADSLAAEGYDEAGSWMDVPADEQYLIGLGFKRGHAARVVRVMTQVHTPVASPPRNLAASLDGAAAAEVTQEAEAEADEEEAAEVARAEAEVAGGSEGDAMPRPMHRRN